jgi:PPOX class probable F420-dependent enzyme
MPSRRRAIELDATELAALLVEGRTLVLGTYGPRGEIHLVPLWYALLDGELWWWTYARSQKARNLERDPRATGLVELGESYEELRGAMLVGRVHAVHGLAATQRVGEALVARYGVDTPDARAAMLASAPKRVAMRFDVERVASWDHRKLGGRY